MKIIASFYMKDKDNKLKIVENKDNIIPLDKERNARIFVFILLGISTFLIYVILLFIPGINILLALATIILLLAGMMYLIFISLRKIFGKKYNSN